MATKRLRFLHALFAGRRWLFWACVLAVTLADQFTKWWLWQPPSESAGPRVIIPGLLRITPHPGNMRGALGLGPQNPYVYVAVALLGLLAIGYFLLTSPAGNGRASGALGLMAGGAVGNLIDRAALGYVRDFVDLHWRNTFHWHTFNVADAAICVGFALLVLDMVVTSREQQDAAPVQR